MIHTSILSILVFLEFVFPFPSFAEEVPRLQMMLDALENKDIQSASVALEKIDSPLNGEECRVLTQTIERLSLRGEWIPWLEKLVEKNPSEVEFIYQTARTYWRAGNEESAVLWCKKAVEKEPGNETLLYRAAAIAYAVNRFEQAKNWIAQLLKINPTHPNAKFLHGCILARQGKNDEARTIFLDVVKTNPDYYIAYFELGKLCNQKGDSQQAELYLKRALDGYPFLREAMNALMIALARQQKQEEIAKIKPVFERLNSWNTEKMNRMWYSFRNPNDIPVAQADELAIELIYVGREDQAQSYMEHRLETGQSSDSQKLMLARIYFNKQDYAKCLTTLSQIQSTEKIDSEGYVIFKVWSLYHTGKIDECRDYYSKYADRYKESEHLKTLALELEQAKSQKDVGKADHPSFASDSPFRFADVTEKVGIAGFHHVLGHSDKRWITDAQGSGVAVGDYDKDGDDDLYFVCGRPELDEPDPKWRNALYRNDGGVFTDVTAGAGVGDTGFGMCAVFGDVNGDGRLDLFVGNRGPNVLYINNGNGTFSDATARAGVGDSGYAAAAAFGDIDADGDLDLYVGNYVAFDPKQHGELRTNYHGVNVFIGPMAFPSQKDCLYVNDGSGAFTDRADAAGINVSEGRAMGVVFFDIDNDGDLDLYVTNDSTYNHVLKNRGDGTFEDISFLSGGAFTESGIEGASMGVIAGDYDNDGLFDLFITSYEQQTDILFHNNGQCYLTDVTSKTGLNQFSRMLITWGSGFCDFDSDGRLDLYTANGHLYPQVDSLNLGLHYNQGISLYRNTGERFEEVSKQSLPVDFKPKCGRGSALLDYDRDGDMDIAINCTDSSPMLLENRSPCGTWLQVVLDGPAAKTYGARVVARKGKMGWTRIADGGSGYLSQNSLVLHFGFGDVEAIDDLTVHWVGGPVQTVASPELNARIRITYP